MDDILLQIQDDEWVPSDEGVDTFTPEGDSIEPYQPNEGAGINDSYFYFADGTELFIARSTALADYDSTTDTSWSIVFPVSGGAIDTAGTITYDSTTTLYDGDASTSTAQTFYRLPVIRGVDFGDGLEPQTLSSGGVYRENIFCDVTKGPIVELIKIA